MSLTARKVKGDPFWKAVRPGGVPDHAQLKPDIVTSRFYTTCFTGVVVPYVCTTGSSVCDNNIEAHASLIAGARRAARARGFSSWLANSGDCPQR